MPVVGDSECYPIEVEIERLMALKIIEDEPAGVSFAMLWHM